ncbi:MAG: hypothetical protein ABIK92_13555 [Pseudomonadota bacterium]
MCDSHRFYYAGTKTEIKLGDNIIFKKFFFKKINGIVYYIPSQSPVNPEMEYENVKHWTIKLDDGRVISWIYSPNEVQPSKRVLFIKRADLDKEGLQPEDNLI